VQQITPTLHEAPAIEHRQPRTSDRDVYKLPNCVPISKRRVDAYHEALARRRERIELSKRGVRAPSKPAPPLIANLERIASLRQSGALSEPECERLKGVLLAAADGGMTVVAPRIYTDST